MFSLYKVNYMNWLKELANKPLEEKANIIQENYEKVIFDKSGIMYSQLKIDGDILRPLEERDMEGQAFVNYEKWRHKPDGAWDLLNYENSITNSGIYLAAQVCRYRATGSLSALEQAHKAFRSLDIIYTFGEKDGRPGWMGKPYSGRLSNQTSPDQYLQACWGLYYYYPYASDDTKKRIEEMFINFAGYWIKVDYFLDYFEHAHSLKEVTDSYNPVYIMINALAYKFTGEEIFKKEAERFNEIGTWKYETMMDARRRMGIVEETLWEYTGHSEFVIVASEIMLDIMPELVEKDMEQVVTLWYNLYKYGMDENFLPFYHFTVNYIEDTWKPLPLTKPLPREQWRYDAPFFSYTSEVRHVETLGRVMYTSLAAIKYAPEIAGQAKDIAIKLLELTDELRLRSIVDLDGKQFIPECKHMGELLSSENPSTYLLTFWKGRLEGLW